MTEEQQEEEEEQEEEESGFLGVGFIITHACLKGYNILLIAKLKFILKCTSVKTAWV